MGNTGYKTVSGDVTVLTQHEWALAEDFSEMQLNPQMSGQHLKYHLSITQPLCNTDFTLVSIKKIICMSIELCIVCNERIQQRDLV